MQKRLFSTCCMVLTTCYPYRAHCALQARRRAHGFITASSGQKERTNKTKGEEDSEHEVVYSDSDSDSASVSEEENEEERTSKTKDKIKRNRRKTKRKRKQTTNNNHNLQRWQSEIGNTETKENYVLRQVTEISSPVPPDGRSEVSCLSRSSIWSHSCGPFDPLSTFQSWNAITSRAN